jgi:hypothetical protein
MLFRRLWFRVVLLLALLALTVRAANRWALFVESGTGTVLVDQDDDYNVLGYTYMHPTRGPLYFISGRVLSGDMTAYRTETEVHELSHVDDLRGMGPVLFGFLSRRSWWILETESRAFCRAARVAVLTGRQPSLEAAMQEYAGWLAGYGRIDGVYTPEQVLKAIQDKCKE